MQKALITFADPDTGSRIVINAEEIEGVENGVTLDVKGEAGPGADPDAPFLAASLASMFLNQFHMNEGTGEETPEVVS